MREYWIKTFGKEPPWRRVGEDYAKRGKKKRKRVQKRGQKSDAADEAEKNDDSIAEANAETAELSKEVPQDNHHVTLKEDKTTSVSAQNSTTSPTNLKEPETTTTTSSTATPSGIPAVAALDTALALSLIHI